MLFFNQNRNHDLDKEAQWGSKDFYEITFNYMDEIQGIVANYLKKKTWQMIFLCTSLHNFLDFDALF